MQAHEEAGMDAIDVLHARDNHADGGTVLLLLAAGCVQQVVGLPVDEVLCVVLQHSQALGCLALLGRRCIAALTCVERTARGGRGGRGARWR